MAVFFADLSGSRILGMIQRTAALASLIGRSALMRVPPSAPTLMATRRPSVLSSAGHLHPPSAEFPDDAVMANL